MKVVIVIPTYNEEGNVGRLVEILEKDIFPNIKNHEMNILIVDDNSPDGTKEEVIRLMKKWKNIDLNIGERKGLGAAYVRGMAYAVEKMRAEIMFEMDADGQHDPKKIPQFLEKIDEGYDMGIGTRYSNGGSIPKNWPLVRKAFSIIGNNLVRLILMRFSIHDWTGGYRVLKKDVFLKEKDELTSFRGYTFQVSFLHKAVRDGFKIAEVPFDFSDRTLGDSKIAPKEYIADLLKYVIAARVIELRRFIKFLIIGGAGFILQIFSQELSVKIGLASAIGIFVSPIVFALSQHHGFNALRDGVAGGLGAETAILSNFILNNLWTFKDTSGIKERSNFLIRLLKFNLISLTSIVIQSVSIWVFVRVLGDSLNIFSYTLPTRIVIIVPVIIFFIVPLNYFIYNNIIWKTQFLKNEKAS